MQAEAHIVIADLTGAHPNVYLEVGYAWGLGKPVIPLVHKGQIPHFDVASQNRIEYARHRQLVLDLTKALKELQEEGVF